MKRKKELLVVLTSLLVIVLSVTVAYFTVQIIGDGKEVSISSANLQIIYEDTDGSISGSNIIPPWSQTKTFRVENSADATYEYDLIIKNLVNTFVTNGYLQYKITSTTGGYNMTDFEDIPKSDVARDTVLAHSISIDVDEVHEYTIEVKYIDADVDQSADMGKTLSGTIMIAEGTEEAKLFMTQLLADNPTRYSVGDSNSPRSGFDVVYTAENTNTLFTTTATEDGSAVYYFAGNAQNNRVWFAGYEWRIIRTNEDGSIRLLFDGDGAGTVDVASSSDYWSSMGGYMYGDGPTLAGLRLNTHDSGMKEDVDNWYKQYLCEDTNGNCTKLDNNNIAYDAYVSRTAIYCDDRANSANVISFNEDDVNLAAKTRISAGKPSYKCGANTTGGLFEETQSIADKFSVSTTSGGNGLLTYPAALMTADEVAFAGGKLNAVAKAWYAYNREGDLVQSNDKERFSFALMTKSVLKNYGYGPSMDGFVFSIDNYDDNSSFNFNGGQIPEEMVIRPVLSLKSCVKWEKGNGSVNDEYIISVDATCAAAEN